MKRFNKLRLENESKEKAYDNGIFFMATGPLFAVAQFFGAMPVLGIMEKEPEKLRFTWKCLRFWYTILLIISQIWFFSCVVIAKASFTLSRITLLVVYGTVSYLMIVLIFVAQKWPKAMIHWTMVEGMLPREKEDGIKRYQMAVRLRKVFVLIFVLSIMEHLLGLLATLTVVCDDGPGTEVRAFFLAHLPVFFKAVSYSHWIAFLGKSANIVNTFMWFYVDLFVMLVAIGLSNIFQLYCDFLDHFKGKRTSNIFWDDQRNFYRQIIELVEKIDRIISPVTVVSFANNLYFICLQLMNTLNERQSALHSLYFWYTLIYLISRTMAVCLFSAEINEQSKRPLAVIKAVPHYCWCNELKRFAEDVADTTAALTGMRFFYLTRKLLLSVAGTILTYELVILQFYEPGTGTVVSMCGNKTMVNFKAGA